MKPAYNDVFRLTSLRGPDRTVSVDPSEDVPDSEVLGKLDGIDVDPKSPSPEVLKRLDGVETLSDNDLDGSLLATIETAISNASVDSAGALEQMKVTFGGVSLTAKELASRREFHEAYRSLVDSWLALTVTDPQSGVRRRHVSLIRAGHLVALLARDPATLAEPGAVRRLRAARVVTPRAWTPGTRRALAVRQRHAATLARSATPAVSDLRATIGAAEREHEDLRQQIDLLDRLQAKAHQTYVGWKRTQLAARPARPLPPRGGSAIARLTGWSSRVPRGVSQATPRVNLDATYVTALTNAATPAERTALSNRLGVLVPGTFDEVLDALDPGSLIDAANRLCRRIQLWEAETTEELPVGSPPAAGTERPLVRAIGWGDLVVARERLIGYDAREIAHVENVMPGEERVRDTSVSAGSSK